MSYRFDRKLIKNPDGKVEFRRFRAGGRDHYHIATWLEGSDEELDRVARVEYRLHPSFKRPVRSSSDRGNKFSITLWAWGMFNVDAVLHFQDGTSESHNYYLNYELPDDDGENYIDLTPDELRADKAT